LREQQRIAERLAADIDRLLRLLMEECPDTTTPLSVVNVC